MATITDVGSIVRVNGSMFSTLVETSRAVPIVRSDQEKIVSTSERSVLFAMLLQLIKELSLAPSAPSILDLIQIQADTTSGLLDVQATILESFDVRRGAPSEFSILLKELDQLEIRISFETAGLYSGSLGKKTLIKIDILSNNATLAAVFGPLIIYAATAFWSDMARIEYMNHVYENMYVCTVGEIGFSDVFEAEDNAVALLVTQTFDNSEHERDVWKARQLCLKAAGVSPGEIDGIYGEATRDAEQSYTEKYNGTVVNWSSRNFARHIILQTRSIYERQLEDSSKLTESNGRRRK